MLVTLTKKTNPFHQKSKKIEKSWMEKREIKAVKYRAMIVMALI